MTSKELAEKTIKDIAVKRERADKEFFGYQKVSGLKRKRGWSIRYGGYRW